MRWTGVVLVAMTFFAVTAFAADQQALDRLEREVRCPRCDLRGAMLADASLSGADLSGSDLRGANLENAFLLGADLSRSRLDGANLRNAFLEDVSLRGASVKGADLAAARFNGADLSGVQGLTQEQLDATCLDELEGAKRTRLPRGLALKPCY